jgi:hypothetical protein
MAASKPTSSLFVSLDNLYTSPYLGTLAVSLACLPLADEAYPSPTDSRTKDDDIRSLIEFGTLRRALVHPVLYLHRLYTRLALKLFRGEPAITGFD